MFQLLPMRQTLAPHPNIVEQVPQFAFTIDKQTMCFIKERRNHILFKWSRGEGSFKVTLLLLASQPIF